MPVDRRQVRTPIGVVTMPHDEADAYEAAQRVRARALGAHHARALKAGAIRICAVVCVLFGALQTLCTWLDALAGSGSVQACLGFVWAIACLVCGLATWRNAASVQPRKEA